jgi:hypothetical protein
MRLHRRLVFALMLAGVAPAYARAATAAAPSPEPRAPLERATRGGAVTVEKGEVTVLRKTFDRRRLPPEMPPLGPNADALTESRFGCSATIHYSTAITRTRQSRAGRAGRETFAAVAQIDRVEVTVDLAVTLWLPRNASQKLVAHEEGHRVISERVYEEEAVAVARAEAQKLIGRTIKASGDDFEASLAAAVKEANEKLCQAYMEATSAWSSRLGNRYDEITDHGKRNRPGADEAVRQVFEQVPKKEEEEGGRKKKDKEQPAPTSA